MARNYKIVNPCDILIFKPTDWNLCFFCQSVLKDDLINPSKKLGYVPERSSYVGISSLLMEWRYVDGTDRSLLRRLEKFENSETLLSAFIENNACFHKICTSRHDKQKLKRKQNIKNSDACKNNKEPKLTRQKMQAPNFTELCFFCEGDGELIHCRSVEITTNVRKMAEKLNDSKILAKLAEGDMFATDAVYHKKCFTQVYNRYKTALRNLNSDEGHKSLEKYVISDVINWLRDSIVSCLVNNQIPVFQQKDVITKYKELLRLNDASEELISAVHCTHVITKIVDYLPGIIVLQEKSGVVLTLDGEIGKAIFQASILTSTDDILVMSDAAKRIRKVLFLEKQTFNGDTSFECQEQGVPDILVQLISMIIDGGKPNRDLNQTQKGIACNIAQLIKFNSVKQCRKETIINFRHAKENEPPLPVMIGLNISKSRNKAEIKYMHNKGLSISYDRVKTIRSSLAYELNETYIQRGFVYPPQIQKNTFTTSAIDNFDYNLKSSTATESIHWTGISIFQYPTSPVDNRLYKIQDSSRKISSLELPSSYTNIQPMCGGKPEPKVSADCNNKDQTFILKKSEEWLKALQVNDKFQRVSFSSFYSKKITMVNEKAICTLLPLIPESINSHAVVAHSMKQIRKITEEANPGQRPVITADQPVYALCKQVQLLSKEHSNFFCKMGDLHTEMAFLSAIGDWLEGSGWTEIYDKSNISTKGRVENFLKGSKVKRTRYAHHVTLKVLLDFAYQAFQNSTYLKYEEWMEELKLNSTTAFYWFTTIDLITILSIFICSIRDPNFQLYRKTLRAMMPWFFALDHTHYARWMTVYISDLFGVEKDNTLYKEFMNGHFAVNKTGKKFSAMGEDQAHEQHNRVIKENGGGVGLFTNAKAILEWSITSSFISDMLEEKDQSENKSHHEDNDRHNALFLSDCEALYNSWKIFGNPFEEHSGLVHMTTKMILSKEAEFSVRNAFKIGKEQYEAFDMLRESLYHTIKKNSLPIFRKKNVPAIPKCLKQVVTLKERCNIFKDLFISCQVRQGNLDIFFSHMNHDFPPSLSEYGKLRLPTSKADILKCLQSASMNAYEEYTEPNVSGCVIDGPAWVHMHPPRTTKIFSEYIQKELICPLLFSNENRIDVVFDVYHDNSLKRHTRDKRGQERNSYIIRNDTIIPGNFENFLKNVQNKTGLFHLIADQIKTAKSDKLLIATKNEIIVSNNIRSYEDLYPCNAEEADTRVYIHVKDQARVFSNVKIVTVDSDVIIVGLSIYTKLKDETTLCELWVEFGTGKTKKWIPLHSYASFLGEKKCMALPFFHAFTGSDTTSQFAGRAKKTAWNTWEVLPEVTDVFISASSLEELSKADIKSLERFVCVMYDRGSMFHSVNECRRYLFTKMSRSIENCPPTSNVLEQHIKRAQLQAFLWVNALEKDIPTIKPELWGWSNEDGLFEPVWSTFPKVADACIILKKCKCLKTCSTHCTCRKNGLDCTELCLCSGQCKAFL